MTLKIVGAGFGRTGTRSLKEALEILGFGPCHHMMEVFVHPETQAPFWDRVALGQPFKWEEGLGGYNSACDWPSCTFYKELAEYYPQSKVILSLRDSKSWYKSVANTIMPAMTQPKEGAGGPRLPGIFAPKLIGERTFNNDFSEAHMIAVYERHNEEVKRVIPKDRLLVFEAKDGWEKLCPFLGVPIPDKPYPNMNTTEEFQTRVRGAAPPAKPH